MSDRTDALEAAAVLFDEAAEEYEMKVEELHQDICEQNEMGVTL